MRSKSVAFIIAAIVAGRLVHCCSAAPPDQSAAGQTPAAKTPSPPAKESAEVTSLRRALESERQRLRRAKRDQMSAPAQLTDLFKHYVNATQKCVQLYEEALRAALAENHAKLKNAKSESGRWRQLTSQINYWIEANRYAVPYRQEQSETDDQSAEYGRRIVAAADRMGNLVKPLLGGDAPPSSEVLNKTYSEMRGVRHIVSICRDVIAMFEQKDRTLQQKKKEQAEVLHARYEEVVQLYDSMIALAKEKVAAIERDASARYNEFDKKIRDIRKRLNAWQAEHTALSRKIRAQEKIAEAPPELRPLLKEAMELNEKAGRAAVKRVKEELSDTERILLSAESRANNIRSRAIEQLARTRKGILETLAGAANYTSEPTVKSLVALGHKMMAGHEKELRKCAELAVQAVELEAKAEIKEEELESTEDKLDAVFELIEEVVELTEEFEEDIADYLTDDGIEEVREELDDIQRRARLQERLRTIPSLTTNHVQLVNKISKDVAEHATQAIILFDKGEVDGARHRVRCAYRKAQLMEFIEDFVDDYQRLQKGAGRHRDTPKAKRINKLLADIFKHGEHAVRLKFPPRTRGLLTSEPL